MDWNFLIKNKEALNVSTDTRNLPKGCVFFALHGETFDGNNFAAQALEKGASLAIIDDPKAFIGPQTILVPNTLKALQSLAKAWRRELGLPIIGITGTNGKTTTKELTAAVLKTKYNLYYTQGNLNNSIGVPLTILSLTRQHELAIVEMGASHPGDIQELVEIAEPNCGLITNVGRAHLQGFGSFEGVKKTKSELYDFLAKHNGFCFRNLDNAHLAEMAGNLQTIGYHTGTMLSGTNLVGDYNSENVQAAICVGEYFGVTRENAEKAIRDYVPTNNRSQLRQTDKNTIVIDAYNANPTSMQAAIQSFKGNCFILGDMLELGEYSHLEHQNIVNLLTEAKAENVFLIGKEFSATTAHFPVFENVIAFRTYLEEHPLTNKHILLKGSRGIKLEQILDIL